MLTLQLFLKQCSSTCNQIDLATAVIPMLLVSLMKTKRHLAYYIVSLIFLINLYNHSVHATAGFRRLIFIAFISSVVCVHVQTWINIDTVIISRILKSCKRLCFFFNHHSHKQIWHTWENIYNMQCCSNSSLSSPQNCFDCNRLVKSRFIWHSLSRGIFVIFFLIKKY